MKNIVAINTSPKREGNTARALKYFMNSINEKGHTSYHALIDYKIGYCKGQLECEKSGKCTQKDDWQKIEGDLLKADVIIIGTPVLMGQESALCKTFLERCRSFLSYIEAIDPNCSSIEELFNKWPGLRDQWPEPVSRIRNNPEVHIILTQSQPNKNKHADLITYLQNIGEKIFNTKKVKIHVLQGLLNPDDFSKSAHEFWREQA
ncbi:MAG: flavodoxin family protein [Nanoarchaeota archaeon]